MKKLSLLLVLFCISFKTYSEGLPDFNINVSYSEYLNQNNEIEIKATYHCLVLIKLYRFKTILGGFF